MIAFPLYSTSRWHALSHKSVSWNNNSKFADFSHTFSIKTLWEIFLSISCSNLSIILKKTWKDEGYRGKNNSQTCMKGIMKWVAIKCDNNQLLQFFFFSQESWQYLNPVLGQLLVSPLSIAKVNVWKYIQYSRVNSTCSTNTDIRRPTLKPSDECVNSVQTSSPELTAWWLLCRTSSPTSGE